MPSTFHITQTRAFDSRGAWMQARSQTARTYREWREVAPERAREAYAGLLAAEEREADALAALLFPST
jgi:hypothetical protein